MLEMLLVLLSVLVILLFILIFHQKKKMRYMEGNFKMFVSKRNKVNEEGELNLTTVSPVKKNISEKELQEAFNKMDEKPNEVKPVPRDFGFKVKVSENNSILVPNPFFDYPLFELVIKNLYHCLYTTQRKDVESVSTEARTSLGFYVDMPDGSVLSVPDPHSNRQAFDFFLVNLYKGKVLR